MAINNKSVESVRAPLPSALRDYDPEGDGPVAQTLRLRTVPRSKSHSGYVTRFSYREPGHEERMKRLCDRANRGVPLFDPRPTK